MKIERCALPVQNKIMQAYYTDQQFIHTFFDYQNEQVSFPERIAELANRNYNRQQLAEVVRSFMEPFGLSEQSEAHLEQLKENAVIVMGGQQAGILTGPLYSVHKAITVILLAKKQEELLGIPVVPMFWVAGEDHDLNEINHVFTVNTGQVTKEQYREKYILKLMASDAKYDQQEMVAFVQNIFRTYGETKYTNEIVQSVLEAVKQEETFTGFFVRLMNGLFQSEGLLFIDSAYPSLREIEKEHFMKMIQQSDELTKHIVKQESEFEAQGFGKPIGVETDAANIFYVHETGRVLLSKKDGHFVNESIGLKLTESELLQIAKDEPWKLSNNVVTRPLMQELLFPVLSFVGGPGEIAYWAVLKDAFHHFNLKLPILFPRMNMTIISRKVASNLQNHQFTFEDVLSGNVGSARIEWIENLRNEQFEEVLLETEKVLQAQYEKISSVQTEMGLSLSPLLEKNLHFHQQQIRYLKDRTEEVLLTKNDAVLRTFKEIENELLPNGAFQERSFTQYHFMNLYGPTLIQDLLQLPFELDEKHNLIYL